MVLMLLIRDISEDFTVSVVFGVLFVISTLMLVLLYRRIRPLSSDSKKMVHA